MLLSYRNQWNAILITCKTGHYNWHRTSLVLINAGRAESVAAPCEQPWWDGGYNDKTHDCVPCAVERLHVWVHIR